MIFLRIFTSLHPKCNLVGTRMITIIHIYLTYRFSIGSNFLIVFENVKDPSIDATKLVDGEVYELSKEHHLWTNRNGAPKKYIREAQEYGKQTGWILQYENGIIIARAGKSLLPSSAKDWKHSDSSVRIIVQEYNSMQLDL